jgi:hypothetical protein
MKKKYPEIQDEQQMASEPLAAYDIHHRTPIIPTTESREGEIMANTVSVDELMLSSRVHRAEMGEERTISNSEVFNSIRTKYGF